MPKTGRPSKYKPEFCKSLVDYFESQANVWTVPHLSKWARTIAGVCHDTAIEWTKEHEEFSEAYKKAKDIQKETLIDGALTGKFQQTFAIFTAKNITDMRDVQETKNETDVRITGFENLKDEQLDGYIQKLKTELGEGAVRESQASGAVASQVPQAA